MLTLASYLSRDHIVDIFWDDEGLKAPISRFLKIDLTRTRFVENIFKYGFFKKAFTTLGYNLIFILSDGSVPATFAAKNILHFQVPFNFPKATILTRLKLKKYNHIVCNSNFTKLFIDKSFDISSEVIYPPVDVKSIKPQAKADIILSVGRFSDTQLHPKKQEVLVEVFKEVYKKNPSWRLVLIGQAKKEDEKYLRKLKKSTRGYAIRILENLAVEKLRNYYSTAKIYWHATGFGEDEHKNPEKMEHFGISTVEAQAGGAVPVVIDRGGQREIVEDGKSGRLWSTKAELYEATLSLIDNPNQLSTLSVAAVKSSRKFSQENFLRHYAKILI